MVRSWLSKAYSGLLRYLSLSFIYATTKNTRCIPFCFITSSLVTHIIVLRSAAAYVPWTVSVNKPVRCRLSQFHIVSFVARAATGNASTLPVPQFPQ